MKGSQTDILDIIERLDCRIVKICDDDLTNSCQKIIDSHVAEV